MDTRYQSYPIAQYGDLNPPMSTLYNANHLAEVDLHPSSHTPKLMGSLVGHPYFENSQYHQAGMHRPMQSYTSSDNAIISPSSFPISPNYHPHGVYPSPSQSSHPSQQQQSQAPFQSQPFQTHTMPSYSVPSQRSSMSASELVSPASALTEPSVNTPQSPDAFSASGMSAGAGPIIVSSGSSQSSSHSATIGNPNAQQHNNMPIPLYNPSVATKNLPTFPSAYANPNPNPSPDPGSNGRGPRSDDSTPSQAPPLQDQLTGKMIRTHAEFEKYQRDFRIALAQTQGRDAQNYISSQQNGNANANGNNNNNNNAPVSGSDREANINTGDVKPRRTSVTSNPNAIEGAGVTDGSPAGSANGTPNTSAVAPAAPSGSLTSTPTTHPIAPNLRRSSYSSQTSGAVASNGRSTQRGMRGGAGGANGSMTAAPMYWQPESLPSQISDHKLYLGPNGHGSSVGPSPVMISSSNSSGISYDPSGSSVGGTGQVSDSHSPQSLVQSRNRSQRQSQSESATTAPHLPGSIRTRKPERPRLLIEQSFSYDLPGCVDGSATSVLATTNSEQNAGAHGTLSTAGERGPSNVRRTPVSMEGSSQSSQSMAISTTSNAPPLSTTTSTHGPHSATSDHSHSASLGVGSSEFRPNGEPVLYESLNGFVIPHPPTDSRAFVPSADPVLGSMPYSGQGTFHSHAQTAAAHSPHAGFQQRPPLVPPGSSFTSSSGTNGTTDYGAYANSFGSSSSSLHNAPFSQSTSSSVAQSPVDGISSSNHPYHSHPTQTASPSPADSEPFPPPFASAVHPVAPPDDTSSFLQARVIQQKQQIEYGQNMAEHTRSQLFKEHTQKHPPQRQSGEQTSYHRQTPASDNTPGCSPVEGSYSYQSRLVPHPTSDPHAQRQDHVRPSSISSSTYAPYGVYPPVQLSAPPSNAFHSQHQQQAATHSSASAMDFPISESWSGNASQAIGPILAPAQPHAARQLVVTGSQNSLGMQNMASTSASLMMQGSGDVGNVGYMPNSRPSHSHQLYSQHQSPQSLPPQHHQRHQHVQGGGHDHPPAGLYSIPQPPQSSASGGVASFVQPRVPATSQGYTTGANGMHYQYQYGFPGHTPYVPPPPLEYSSHDHYNDVQGHQSQTGHAQHISAPYPSSQNVSQPLASFHQRSEAAACAGDLSFNHVSSAPDAPAISHHSSAVVGPGYPQYQVNHPNGSQYLAKASIANFDPTFKGGSHPGFTTSFQTHPSFLSGNHFSYGDHKTEKQKVLNPPYPDASSVFDTTISNINQSPVTADDMADSIAVENTDGAVPPSGSLNNSFSKKRKAPPVPSKRSGKRVMTMKKPMMLEDDQARLASSSEGRDSFVSFVGGSPQPSQIHSSASTTDGVPEDSSQSQAVLSPANASQTRNQSSSRSSARPRRQSAKSAQATVHALATAVEPDEDTPYGYVSPTQSESDGDDDDYVDEDDDFLEPRPLKKGKKGQGDAPTSVAARREGTSGSVAGDGSKRKPKKPAGSRMKR